MLAQDSMDVSHWTEDEAAALLEGEEREEGEERAEGEEDEAGAGDDDDGQGQSTNSSGPIGNNDPTAGGVRFDDESGNPPSETSPDDVTTATLAAPDYSAQADGGRPSTAPAKLSRSGTRRRLDSMGTVGAESSDLETRRMIEDIDAVNSSGQLTRRPKRKVQKTISVDIRPGAGSAAQVMLAMRLRAQLDALRTLSSTYDSIERALRVLRLERRMVGLTCVHRRFLAVAHAAAVCEVVLDCVALQAMISQLHDAAMAIPFLEAMKDTEVTLQDLDDAANYLRSTAPDPLAGVNSCSGGAGSIGGVPLVTDALFDDLAELGALAVQVAELEDGADNQPSPGDSSFAGLLNNSSSNNIGSLSRDNSSTALGGGKPSLSRSASAASNGGGRFAKNMSAARLLKAKSMRVAAAAAVAGDGSPDSSPSTASGPNFATTPATSVISGPSSATSSSSPATASDAVQAGIEIPLAVQNKAEDIAADRFRRDWPRLLWGPVQCLRRDAGWSDEAFAQWLRERGLRDDPVGKLRAPIS